MVVFGFGCRFIFLVSSSSDGFEFVAKLVLVCAMFSIDIDGFSPPPPVSIGIFFLFINKNKTIAYSVKATKTWPKHTRKKRSILLIDPLDFGAFDFTLIYMFMSINSTVTSNPIRPGTTSGGTMKETQARVTNIILGK